MIENMVQFVATSHDQSVLMVFREGYLDYLNFAVNLARYARPGIGARLENTWLDLLNTLQSAYFTSQEEKIKRLNESVMLADRLKFFLALAYEAKLIPEANYQLMIKKVLEGGRMLGGWRKAMLNKTASSR